MNTKLIKAWLNSGAAPLEDFGPAIGLTDIEIIRIMNGRQQADEGTQYVLAELFDSTVDELFSDE